MQQRRIVQPAALNARAVDRARACRLLVSHGGYTMRGRLKATNSCRMWSDVHVELTMTACHGTHHVGKAMLAP